MKREPMTVIDLLPEIMRAPLRDHPDGLGLARDWLEADDDTRADLLAFFESDGPAKVERIREDLEDGDGWKLGGGTS